MPTISQQPEPVQWIVALANAQSYVGKAAALIAATALSAANANAPVQMAEIWEQDTAASAGALANVQILPSGTPVWLVQLQSAQSYYPLEAARVAARALSVANSSAAVNIARVNQLATAP